MAGSSLSVHSTGITASGAAGVTRVRNLCGSAAGKGGSKAGRRQSAGERPSGDGHEFLEWHAPVTELSISGCNLSAFTEAGVAGRTLLAAQAYSETSEDIAPVVIGQSADCPDVALAQRHKIQPEVRRSPASLQSRISQSVGANGSGS